MNYRIKFPFLFEYHQLGGHTTEDGVKYFLRHSIKVRTENNELLKINHARYEMGGVETIHCMESEMNYTLNNEL